MREAEEDSQVAMDEPEFSRPSRETRSKQRGELKRNSTHHVHNANIEKMQKRPRHNRYLHGQGERVSGSTEEPHEQLSSNEQTLPFLRGSTPDPDFRPRSGTVSPPQIERCPINKELEDSIRPEVRQLRHIGIIVPQLTKSLFSLQQANAFGPPPKSQIQWDRSQP